MLKWVDKLPVKPLLVVAVFFALVPFQPEPHFCLLYTSDAADDLA